MCVLVCVCVCVGACVRVWIYKEIVTLVCIVDGFVETRFFKPSEYNVVVLGICYTRHTANSDMQ